MVGDAQSVAEGLTQLHKKALQTLSARLPCPVATYRAIAVGVAENDLLSDEAESTRRRFNAYYGVRRNAAWRAIFYERFEAAKHSTSTGVDLFADIVRGIEAQTGRVEASFASKLVATLHPEQPIIDSVIRRWLKPLTVAPPFRGEVDVVIAYYRWLGDLMAETIRTREAQAWIRAFAASFPAKEGEPSIPAMKKLDFLIWAGAER
jgi:hypothetical protein